MIVKVKKAKNQGWAANVVKGYEGTITKIGVAVDRNGYDKTGLTSEDEERLELALGLPKNMLKKGSLRFPSPFWIDYSIKMEGNTPLILDTDNPEDELKYLVMKAQKKVAKTVAESRHPSALFVIYNEEDEADRENKRGKNKRLAYRIFDELSTVDQKNILMLYGKNTSTSSPAIIESQLLKLLEDDPATFLIHANDPALKDKVFVLSLVSAGILSRKGGAFIEYSTDEVLAYDMDTMIKFVQDKKNQGKVLQFKEALKTR